MLTETVDELNDADRLAGRDIDPAVDLIPLVERAEFDFM
jgi:hypothetical protein